MKNIRNKEYLLWTMIGFIMLVVYINMATLDVPVINDYIREINNYVGDGKINGYLFSSVFFLQPPIKLLSSWINCSVFGFSVKMDLVLGALGLALGAGVFGLYCTTYKMKRIPYIVLLFYIFSLSKWEMIINGTGWEHFWGFAGFWLHFYLLDLWYIHEEKEKGKSRLLVILPIVNILGFAVFYGLVYSIVVTGFYLIIILDKVKRKSVIRNEVIFALAVAVPIVIYIICSIVNSDTRVVANGRIIDNFLQDPFYFIQFFVMSFSSEIVGVETVLGFANGEQIALMLGLVVITFYIAFFLVNIVFKIYKETYMPLILLTYGFLNHGIVLASRWGFNSITYGMSSRYSLQYMSGGIGILLTAYWLITNYKKRGIQRVVIVGSIFILIFGNGLTSWDEVHKAKYRKAFYDETKQMMYLYEDYTEEQLGERFNIDGQEVYKALTTLEQEQLSVWGSVSQKMREEE
ncbi:MAG: hypothetical protein H2184_04530 [Candidatus Galacturonibacter soehngenii]|nr:hypothetical protein [Candidatus Galacturonibacter soehngenii]